MIHNSIVSTSVLTLNKLLMLCIRKHKRLYNSLYHCLYFFQQLIICHTRWQDVSMRVITIMMLKNRTSMKSSFDLLRVTNALTSAYEIRLIFHCHKRLITTVICNWIELWNYWIIIYSLYLFFNQILKNDPFSGILPKAKNTLLWQCLVWFSLFICKY